MKKSITKKKLNPICAILWQDAAYSTRGKKPTELPLLTLTAGFIISTNKKFTNICTSASYENGKLIPKDGFLVPNKAIVDFRKIDYYEKS